MNHYNITFVLQGYKHSLCLLANDDAHAHIVFKNILVRRDIEFSLCDIVLLEPSKTI